MTNSPWIDAMDRQNNPSAKASFGPQSWNVTSYVSPKWGTLDKLVGSLGAIFGGAGTSGGAATGGAGGGMGPSYDIQTPYNPAPVYGDRDMQIARNQMRAQVPTALASGAMHTPAGVSHTVGSLGDIARQQQGMRMAGEEATQQAMLQARLENARNLLAGQTGVMQSGLGLAGGVMDRAGTDQRLRYGLANQGLERGSMGLQWLLGMMGYA